MKIKKTAKTIKAPAVSGGAAIADRFKLDDDIGAKKTAPAPKSTAAAFFTALVALGVAGVLTFMLYKHWEFLMPA